MAEEYKVLARKWRPQQFDELIGQGHVVQTLRNAITTDRIANAYLFVGPRGVGKTSIARVMAKALNCRNRKPGSADPCDKCDSCLEIKDSRSMDVLEFDAASNTQVDKVRELIIDSVRYRPSRDPFKIYIVDEVHMLSASSFNALLKTLEEPPSHVRFMFATTEPQKVPVTILSRCQRFDLRRIATRDIVTQLDKIAKAEGVKTDQDALIAIARGAEGGLRDAESALDQLIAFRGKEIREEDVLSVFGLVSRKALEGLSEALLKGEIPTMLSQIAAIEGAGKDLSRLAAELLDYFRNLLVTAHAGGTMTDQDVADAQLETMKKQAAIIDPARLLRVVEIMIELAGQLRFALSRRTAIEVALIRAARASSVASIDEVIRMVRQLQSGAPATPSTPIAATREAPVSYGMTPSTLSTAPAAPRPAPPSGNELEVLTAKWHEFIDKVGMIAALAKAPLRDAKPVSVSSDRVVIGIDPEFARHRETLTNPRTISSLKTVLRDMFHRAFEVEIRLLESSEKTLPTDHAPAKPQAAASAGGPKKSRQDWEKEPEVRSALEAFNGGIVDIRE